MALAAKGRLVGLLAASALVVVGAAGAKSIEPGDLRVCGAVRCVGVMDPAAARAFGTFMYLGRQPAVVAPRLGTPMFELRFSNGYATGIVAGPHRDRFLSYGVYLERFRRGRWYRLTPRAALGVRQLTADLRPRPLTRAAVRRSR